MDRRILYAGLLVVAGAGLVRAMRGPRIRPGLSKLLVIGDEMAAGISVPLKALGKEAKISVDCLAKSGATIDHFVTAGAPVLDQKIKAVRPTLILVSLGLHDDRSAAAELLAKKAPVVDRFLSDLSRSGAEILWIGPPKTPWTSHGVPGLIRDKVAKGAYFRSEALAIPRGPDGLMPTARGFAGWSGSVWRWVS